jgi:hypothetical protein
MAAIAGAYAFWFSEMIDYSPSMKDLPMPSSSLYYVRGYYLTSWGLMRNTPINPTTK